MRQLASLAALLALQSLALAAPLEAQDLPPPPPPPPQALTVPPGYAPAPELPPAPPPAPQQPYAQQPYAVQPYAQQPYTVVPIPGPAAPPEPARHGFTVEIGLGIAWLGVPSDDFSEIGLHGLTVGLGGFLSPSVAIEARVTSATILGDADSMTFSSLLVGMQYWANDWLMVGGGLGTCLLQSAFMTSDFGFALDARVGAAFAHWSSGAMRVTLELAPGWIDGELAAMTALALEYQYF